jgi:hypothetical protein
MLRPVFIRASATSQGCAARGSTSDWPKCPQACRLAATLVEGLLQRAGLWNLAASTCLSRRLARSLSEGRASLAACLVDLRQCRFLRATRGWTRG